MQTTRKSSVTRYVKDVQIDIRKQWVVLLFPNLPVVSFPLEVPDLRCAGQTPTYTYKAWVWCAYINALQMTGVRLGTECNRSLFRKIWRRIKDSGIG